MCRWRGLKADIRLGRQHEKWESAAADQKLRADDLEEKLQAERDSNESVRAAARQRGRRDVIGEILAAETASTLTIVASTVSDDERPMVGEISPGDDCPLINGRWFLVVRGLSTVVADFIVEEILEDGHVLLRMNDQREPEMFAELMSRARVSSEPPTGVVLRRRPIDSVSDLLKEF